MRRRAAFALALLALATPASAQVLRDDLYAANGDVNAIAVAGSTVYLGGTFTRLVPHTGGAAALDATTGDALAVTKLVGRVECILPDEAGGWYLGGVFSSVLGVSRNNLAHIRADHSLDPAFAPTVDSEVRAMVLINGVLYLGGRFNVLNGIPRSKIGAVDAATGATTAWDPNANNDVYALARDGSRIYVGGGFTSIGGQARNRIAVLNAFTDVNNALSWDPNADNFVWSLAVDGTKVYAGGDCGIL